MNKIVTENAPKAIGPYSQGMVFENLVFSSGQIPVNPATGEIEGTSIETQAAQSCKNVAGGLGGFHQMWRPFSKRPEAVWSV